jgi:serine/threonine kinase PknH
VLVTEQVGAYHLDQLIGRSGMGEVWLATDTRTDSEVTIRLLAAHVLGDPDRRERFRREVAVAATVTHPHILPVWDYSVDDRPYVVTPYVKETVALSGTLAVAPMAPARAVRIVNQIASALDAAHQAGMVHRDVKPSNILLASDGAEQRAILIDFALAQPIDSPATTTDGQLIGTPAYVAPERLKGARSDHRADVYSLGVVLFECLAGHEALTATALAALDDHLSREPEALPWWVSDALRAVIVKGVAKNPDDRWQSAGELAAAASAALTSQAVPASNHSAPPVSHPEGGASTALFVPGALAVVAGLVLLLTLDVRIGAVGMAVGAALIGASVWMRRRRPAPVAEVTVYTTNDDGEPLRDAVVEVLEVAGFEVVSRDDPVRGSWFQRLFVRHRDSAAVKKLGELAEEAVRAAQLKYINTPRSESDEREANAIARLAEAMSNETDAVVFTSSILFIKTGGRLVSRVLTEAEIRKVQSNPELMRAPQELLQALSMTTTLPAAPEACPTCDHQPVDARERWQQHRDLTITWLSPAPDDPTRLVERRHCQHCRPHEPEHTVACGLCGNGPVLADSLAANGKPPDAVLAWLKAQGWHDQAATGLVCADHS